MASTALAGSRHLQRPGARTIALLRSSKKVLDELADMAGLAADYTRYY